MQLAKSVAPSLQEVEDQRLEDQRLATQKRRKGAESMNNEELKAKTEQIFNSSEAELTEDKSWKRVPPNLLQAFNILSNELFQLQTRMPSGRDSYVKSEHINSLGVQCAGVPLEFCKVLERLQGAAT